MGARQQAAKGQAAALLLDGAAFAALVGLGVHGVNVFAESGFVKTGLPALAPGLGFLGGYSANEFWGAALACVCLPLSVVPATLGIGETFAAYSLPRIARFCLLVAWTATFVALAALAYDDWNGRILLDCAGAGCAFTSNSLLEKETDLPNGFLPTLGVVCVLVCTLLALLSLLLALALVAEESDAQRRSVAELGEIAPREDGGGHEPLLGFADVPVARLAYSTGQRRRQRRKVALALLAGATLPAAFVALTALLPSSWLQMTRTKVATVASMDVASTARECHLAAATSSAPPLFPFQRATCPELPGASFRTSAFLLREERQNSHRVIAKLYPDVLIFYGLLQALVLVGGLSATSWRVRAMLHKRCMVGPGGAWLAPSALQVSLAALVSAAVSLFVWHWYVDHNWHSYWPQTLPWVKPPSTAEKLARTLGQLGNMLLGMLLLPATRNSMWVLLYEVPWEVLIGLHRFGAYAFLLCTLAHGLAWWVVFAEQGVFPHDAFAVNMYFPLNFHAKPGQCSWLACLDPEYQVPGADNWTIPLANLFMIFVGLPVFGLLTLNAVRRWHFELFYYAHHAFLVLLVVVLWHASSSWFFLALPVFLWVVDRVVRFLSGAAPIELAETKAHVGPGAVVTSLVFAPRKLGACAAGQYVFLNVPSVSRLQWHPFSLSSVWPGAVRVDVRACGDFTEMLHLRAREGTVGLVRVDGPYGVPFVADYIGRDVLALFAGGIGCTPMFALLSELAALAPEERPALVHFVWTAASINLLQVFADRLLALRTEEGLPSWLCVSLFLTSRKGQAQATLGESGLEDGPAPEVSGLTLRQGRPSVDLVLDELIDGHRRAWPQSAAPLAAAFACGPQSLVDAVQVAAARRAMDFRAETFAL